MHDKTPPAWHADALREAEVALAQGQAQLLNWDVVKETLERLLQATREGKVPSQEDRVL
jgi:hypothetical protein